MATQLVPTRPPTFLNFENPQDMLSKLEEADAALAQADDTLLR